MTRGSKRCFAFRLIRSDISRSSRIVDHAPGVERLHELLQTHGDTALRTPFERGVAEQAIGAEYITRRWKRTQIRRQTWSEFREEAGQNFRNPQDTTLSSKRQLEQLRKKLSENNQFLSLCLGRIRLST